MNQNPYELLRKQIFAVYCNVRNDPETTIRVMNIVESEYQRIVDLYRQWEKDNQNS